jgi:TolB protein
MIIAKDLDLSGYFTVINPNAYVEPAGKCVGPDSGAYEDWALIKTQWLVRGVVSGSGTSTRVVLELHDVPTQRRIFSKEYSAAPKELRKTAHLFANEIMREVTGELGPFGSRVAFAARIGRFKDLFVMDLDGENLRQLTTDRGIATSPAWDRAGRRLLFTSYRTRQPNLYVLDVDGGGTLGITSGPALEIGGAFTLDGNRIVTSLTESRDSDLVEFSTQGQMIRRLTKPNQAIDVSPAFSPDGQKIAFCSDRGGSPQIYVMGWNGEDPKRASFTNSSYCTSPSWSPKGDRIAFVCRADGGFQLFIANPDGSDPVQITGGGDNEDPDWSPDGRYLVFASTFGKRGGSQNLAMIRVAKNLEGTNQRQITFGRGNDTEPTWSAVLQ